MLKELHVILKDRREPDPDIRAMQRQLYAVKGHFAWQEHLPLVQMKSVLEGLIEQHDIQPQPS